MRRKIWAIVMLLFLAINVSGCFYLLAGAAGGAGTAAWLSGKLSHKVDASFERTVEATRRAIKSFNFAIEKETLKKEVAQFITKYHDGRKTWIDVRRLSPTTSNIEVRVGALPGDKEASTKLLNRIESYL